MAGLIDFNEAIEALSRGGVVAVPTDTVYGVAASLANPEAVAKLFALKNRPSTVPLPVLVDSLNQVARLGVTWPADAATLSEAFWPGPLTIIVRVPHELARRVGATLDGAGFRLPDDALLRRVLERTGPLALTSANEHGAPPCHSAAEVLESLGGRDELFGVLDDGERSSEVSTVVDLSSQPWRVVRAGSIAPAVLVGILG